MYIMSRALIVASVIALFVLSTATVDARRSRSDDELLRARIRTISHHLHQVVSPPDADESFVDPPEMWFTQKLDHFNALDTRTYQQRYYVNTQFWTSKTNPVFLFIGGEGPLATKWVSQGLMFDLAQKYGALLVAVEHRYYGKSTPVSDLSTPNMQWLSSKQALYDLANFQQTMTSQWGADGAKWVAFGGSYPGNLAAWYRLKFPNLVVGSVAASAPVNAKLDYFEYYQVMQATLGTTCASLYNIAITNIGNLLTSDSGRQQLAAKFSTCQPITDPALFAYAMIDPAAEAVQYDNPPSFPVGPFCKQFEISQWDEVTNLSILVQNSLKQQGLPCLDIDMFADLRNTTVSMSNARPWYWQKCTEFGYFKNARPGGIVLPLVDATLHERFCRAAFGVYPPPVNDTNAYYGGLEFGGTNVFFTNGDYDPWHALSILQPIPARNVQSFVYTGAAHCAPLYQKQDNDPPSVTQCRQQIDSFIGGLL